MRDIELFGHLKALGMPESKAWDLTAKIRDSLHPVAAVAASKLHGAGHVIPKGPTMSGLGADIRSGISDASMGAKVAQMAIPIPVVGAVIGAVIGGLIGAFFGPAKLGQASITWNDMTAHRYLYAQRGAAFDEKYFGEALKGAMDEGNNVWPKNGPDRHKDPDGFFGPLADVIRNAYLARQVPLTATTDQVWNQVVLPWLRSGAGGLINWGTLANEPQQQLLIEAATDRYINNLPITRADMPSYAGQGYSRHTPSISAAIQSAATPQMNTSTMVAPIAQQTSASVPASIFAQGGQVASFYAPPARAIAPGTPGPQMPVYGPQMPVYYAPPAGGTPTDTTAAIMSQLVANQGAMMQSAQAQGLMNQVAAQGVQTTQYGPPPAPVTAATQPASKLPSWIVPAGIAAFAGVVELAKKR